MPLTLYEITIPVFTRALTQVSAILQKASDHASSTKVPPSQLVETKLAPDMRGLPFQIQTLSDTAKFVAVRVAGIEPVPMEDTETTFEELQTRVKRTIELLEGVEKTSMDGKEDEEVVLKRFGDIKFTAKEYVLGLALPNFWFHVVTAYDILRHAGVPLVKLDYLGPPPA
ncbi:hypothetical protein MMC12_006458 [Toensbergia leucococca]|nr:hypothetical protein [Toensbergia leucococca]